MKQEFYNEKPIDAPGLSVNINNNNMNLGDCIILKRSDTVFFDEVKPNWDLLSLQDGIDFIRYAINMTTDTMRFANINKTVGGPIDILVIKPNSAFWISHKELH